MLKLRCAYVAHPPKTGPLTRLGFPCNSSPELQEKSNEEEAVYGRADCADAAGGLGSRSDGGPGVQGKRHFGTDVVSLEEQVRPDGRGGGSADAGTGGGKRPAQADRGRAGP